jgi:hypothetical protein
MARGKLSYSDNRSTLSEAVTSRAWLFAIVDQGSGRDAVGASSLKRRKRGCFVEEKNLVEKGNETRW